MTDDDILVVGSETVEFEEQNFRQKLKDMISEVASNHLKYLYNDIAYICLPEDSEDNLNIHIHRLFVI